MRQRRTEDEGSSSRSSQANNTIAWQIHWTATCSESFCLCHGPWACAESITEYLAQIQKPYKPFMQETRTQVDRLNRILFINLPCMGQYRLQLNPVLEDVFLGIILANFTKQLKLSCFWTSVLGNRSGIHTLYLILRIVLAIYASILRITGTLGYYRHSLCPVCLPAVLKFIG